MTITIIVIVIPKARSKGEQSGRALRFVSLKVHAHRSCRLHHHGMCPSLLCLSLSSSLSLRLLLRFSLKKRRAK